MRRRYLQDLSDEDLDEFGGCARPCWDREGTPEHTYAWGSCEKAPASAQPDPDVGFWRTGPGADGYPVIVHSPLPFAAVFPWAMALPVKERHQMVEEISDSADPAQALHEWRETAAIWADPAMLDVLGGEGFDENNYTDAPRPGVEGA